MYDCNGGERVKQMKGHSSYVNSCDTSRKNINLIVSGSDDCTTKVCFHLFLNYFLFLLFLITIFCLFLIDLGYSCSWCCFNIQTSILNYIDSFFWGWKLCFHWRNWKCHFSMNDTYSSWAFFFLWQSLYLYYYQHFFYHFLFKNTRCGTWGDVVVMVRWWCVSRGTRTQSPDSHSARTVHSSSPMQWTLLSGFA